MTLNRYEEFGLLLHARLRELYPNKLQWTETEVRSMLRMLNKPLELPPTDLEPETPTRTL